MRKLERRICEAAAHFVPVNRPIWDALFPDWEAVQPTLDLIVGYPEPYDAVAAHSPDGQDRKSTRLNSSHNNQSRMPSSA